MKGRKDEWGKGVEDFEQNFRQESSFLSFTHKQEKLLLESEMISYNAALCSSYKRLYCY